jgi:hypothetical protein
MGGVEEYWGLTAHSSELFFSGLIGLGAGT